MQARNKWMVSAVMVLMCAATAAHTADIQYPTRPVHIIVPYPPGGTTDPTARAFGTWFPDRFGFPVVIDNRPGAAMTC